MQTNQTTHILLLIILLLTAAGCSPNSAQPGTTEPAEVTMQKTIRNETGGYAFHPLEGYETTVYEGTVTMYPLQKDVLSGPGMEMMNNLFDQEVSLDQAIAVTIKIYPEYTFTETKKIKVDGLEAASMEFTTIYHSLDGVIPEYQGADEGEEIRGRVILVMVTPTRQFKCLMLAPARIWKEVSPQFDAVIRSLKFFETGNK